MTDKYMTDKYDEYILNIIRWDGLEQYLGRDLWLGQKESGGPGCFTTVEVNPLEWVAPLVRGRFVPDDYIKHYPVYVRVTSDWVRRTMHGFNHEEAKR